MSGDACIHTAHAALRLPAIVYFRPDLSSEHQTCMGNGLPGSLQHFHLKISFVIFVCVWGCMHMCMRVWMPMRAHAEYGMLVDHIGCFLLLCGYWGCAYSNLTWTCLYVLNQLGRPRFLRSSFKYSSHFPLRIISSQSLSLTAVQTKIELTYPSCIRFSPHQNVPTPDVVSHIWNSTHEQGKAGGSKSKGRIRLPFTHPWAKSPASLLQVVSVAF